MHTASVFFRAPALFLSALLLSGCASTFPQEYAKTDLISTEEMERDYILDTRWWQRYQLAALDDAVNMALARNADLAQAAISVNKALYQARLIQADLLPVFSGSGSAQATRDVSTDTSSVRSFQGAAEVSYEIDLWRRLSLAASAQEWEYRATVEDMASTRLALINNVIDTWFQLQYLDQAIRLTSQDVNRYEQLANLLKIKYEAGKVAAVEPLQAQQSLLAARNSLLSYRTQRSAAVQTMRDLMNLHPDEEFPFLSLDLMTIPSVSVDLSAPVAALAARPDIAAAEARLREMFSSLESQRRAWYPQISLGSSLSASSASASDFFDAPMLGGLVKISFPFLDWNTLRWNTKISEAEFESAKLSFTTAVTRALNEVDASYISYANACRTLNNTIAKNNADTRIVAYYQVRYELGAAELKDYLDAMNTASSSALSALEAKYRALALENSIYKAMGGRYVKRQEEEAPQQKTRQAPALRTLSQQQQADA